MTIEIGQSAPDFEIKDQFGQLVRPYAEAQRYEFPLLSDFWPHGAVAKTYGVFNEEAGFAIRGTFLVDVDGVVRWSVVNGPGEARPLAAYREAVAAL